MLNIIWVCIISASFIFSIFTGNVKSMGEAFFSGSEEAVSFMLKTGSFMIMWQGFLSVADDSGLMEKISHLLSGVICRLFKNVKKGSRDEYLISGNLTANMLGLSNAATPLGIKAMNELSLKSRDNTATDDMCLLAVINSASLQIIPSTLIAMRSSYKSSNPSEICVPIWIVSFLTVVFAITITKIMGSDKHFLHR